MTKNGITTTTTTLYPLVTQTKKNLAAYVLCYRRVGRKTYTISEV